MPSNPTKPVQWTPDEVIVRLVDASDGYPAYIGSRRSEAGVYDPVFSLWDGPALLNFLFKMNSIPKTSGVPSPVLWLNLMMPSGDSADVPH
jgi:hypothetical protein